MTDSNNRAAWIAGFQAGEAAGLLQCPYPARGNLAFYWYAGYVEGDAKRQGFEYSLGSLTLDDVRPVQ